MSTNLNLTPEEQAKVQQFLERLKADHERFGLTPEQLVLASSGAKRDLAVIEQHRSRRRHLRRRKKSR